MRTSTLYLLACLILPAAWGLIAAWAYSAVAEWRRSRTPLRPPARSDDGGYMYYI
jgi:hypothetical protein